MNDEFDDILLDDYDIDNLDRSQPNVSSLADDNDESQATTTSKKPPKKKFNADLLLEPKGIYMLKNETQFIKFKRTKGHEHEDLKKLMTYYTIWANNLYPGLLIQDFARRVVNPAKSKSVRSVMDQWNDEFRQRRQVRLDVQNELSGKTVGDEDGTDGNDRTARDDESSEDDNRPLFFPISNTNRATSAANTAQSNTAKSKGKSKAKSNMAKPKTKTFIDSDDEDDEQPLFASSQQSNKRKVVLDDSSDEEDTYNMSRSSALALIIERKRKREQAQREEQQRSARPKPSASRTIIEDYNDEEDEPALFDHQDKDEEVELALSDSELVALGIPTQKPFSAQEDPVEEVELALTEAEMLELGLPVSKPDDATTTTTLTALDDDIQLALSDNELETLGLATTTTGTTTSKTANNTQPQLLEEEQFSDNELFDIQEA